VGQQSFDRLTLPVLLISNKSYFLFLKTLLSVFVNCELALKPGSQFSDNKIEKVQMGPTGDFYSFEY
jgi:hypothetical protein